MELSKAQRAELLSELRLERSRKYADRIRVILLLDQGKPVKQIAEFLFMYEGSLRNYRCRYEEGGVERLVNDHYIGRKAFLTDEQQLLLILELESKVYPTTKSVIEFIKSEFGVTYSVGGVTNLLHQLGFSYKKPKGVPGKANAEAQRKFINQYNAVKAHGPVYFADSTHPMLNPVLSSLAGLKRGKILKSKPTLADKGSILMEPLR